MLVASHIESGDKAVAAAFPQVIGNIHTTIGGVTLRRAHGNAVQVMAGDAVCHGDVVETGADGQIGIRFIDGTMLVLSRGTRLVLDEFVCDPDGITHAALFSVTRGTFAFVSGRTAKTGSLRIDTPVGSIRGRGHAGGFGMLSLAALTFATISDVKAADPDATFVDDDNIAFKDLDHGVFELWTKEATPRHIIVEDPAETVILTKRGSSISVNQVANSAARMEELQAAQQAVLANFAKGYAPGSSTPYFLNTPSLQPINYVQPGAPATQNSLPPLESAPNPIFYPLIPPPPPPVPPTLNAAIGPIEVDTPVFDAFSTTTGHFTASSSRADATLTYGISGGTPGETVLNGVTYDVSKTGSYGTLYLNSATGAYAFVPNNDAINALKTDTIQSFTITVSDGALSASEPFAVNIHGVEDAAIISGTVTGAVIEIHGVVDATPGTQMTIGMLTDTDPDDPANTFTAVSSPTKSAGGYGTFTMTMAGVWTYTLDGTNSAVEALKVGGTLTDTFTVTSIDGTPKEVTITIHGPMIAVTGTAPSLTLSETHLTATVLDDNIAGSAPNASLTTTSGNFSTAFTSVQGVDGATISYALSITGGNGTASGLIDSHTGQADVLVLNGNTIEGHVGTSGGTLAFTITVDPTTGLVTFTEYRPVTQPFGTNPDGGEGASLTTGIVNLTATVTDKDGNFQTASRDLGSRLTFTDDGPMIAATGTAPSLTLSETHLTATALDGNIAGSAPDVTLTTTSGNFAATFTSVQGADGATISYALSITGGNGTASGLIDSHTGQADVLVLNGNTIEGHVGTTSGTLAFTMTLDPTTGLVTFTEYRPVTQSFGTNPDGGEGASLTTGIVTLTATITDKDGDFQTASLDLGSRLTITDDGPTIGGFAPVTIVAKDNQVANGTFNVSFGADGDGAMRAAIHDGAVNGYNLATTALGGGITSVHVTGNGDDYVFYYTTHAASGGVELNAFFTDTGGTLSDPFFTLLINPDGTYTFDIEGVGFLQQTTVSGSDFGASGGGQMSLTAPDGLLVITGDLNGAPADVKASNNGIAVGDSGLQMDQHETLLLTFTPEQTDVSFILTQWQGNGTADVIFKVCDGATDVHDFNISIPKPSGDARIVVEKTSNLALVNTYAFDSATSTYTLYVGSDFNRIGVSYDHAVTGNTTFTVNDITYSEGPRIPSTDLLFDVTAVDRDGDASTTSLQVGLLGSTSVASVMTLSATSQLAAAAVNGTNGSGATIGGLSGDMLTGSSGNDVFVYSAVADSNSIQPDTISDFASGADKINLTAFGALAFMHLAATSTTVPPHTLAWIYDSASNETIVYVNPTDNALDIGDEALLEIHLQGVTSVQASDFEYEPAATTVAAAVEGIDPALLVTTASDGTVLTTGSAEASIDPASESTRVTDGSWTMPAADEGFKFHFAHDLDSIGSVRLARFDEAPAYATEDSHGNAAFNWESASSTELRHDHAATAWEDHVAADQGHGHASAGAVTPPNGTIDHADITVANAIAAAQHVKHDAAQEDGASPDQPQHDPYTASEHGSANAELQHAKQDVAQGNDAGTNQAQQDLHTASEHGSANAELQHAKQDARPDNDTNPDPSQHSGQNGPKDASSKSTSTASGPDHDPADAQVAAAHGQDLFHFKNEVAASNHANAVDPIDVDHAPAAHGHGAGPDGPAAIPATEMAELPPAEDHAAAHANVHAASHGAHDLIV